MLNNVSVRKPLWLALAILALVGTWAQILGDLGPSLWNAQVNFWTSTLASPVTRFLALDLLFLATVVAYWMLAEGRRLKMRFVWLYVLYGAFCAISSGFPLFMYARERALERANERDGTLSAVDQLIVFALLVFSVGHLWLSLRAAMA